jgi:hypothetical protein
MTDELKDKQRRAQEISDMIRDGDKRRADAEGNLDKLLTGLNTVVDGMKAFRDRLDALENAHLKMHGSRHRGPDPVPADSGSPPRSPWSTGDDAGKVKEPGEPNPVVADSLFGAGDRGAFYEAQDRADTAFRSWGLQGSPAPLWKENLKDYRIRLIEPHQKHSRQFGKADLNVSEPLFSELEKTILADSVAMAHDNASQPDNVLRQITKKDHAGRVYYEFVGSPKSWMSAFAGNRRRVVKINNSSHA